MKFFSIGLFLFFASCGVSDTPPPLYDYIEGRGMGAVYRVQVPPGWEKKLPPQNKRHDTTVPLCTYSCEGTTLTVYNFPTDSMEQRIPPAAQVERWKKQIDCDPLSLECVPVAWGGFSGLRFFAANETTAILGWAMSIAPELYRHLAYGNTAEEKLYGKEMRADFTLKAQGAPEAIEKHKHEIEAFAHSFELIHPIPSR